MTKELHQEFRMKCAEAEGYTEIKTTSLPDCAFLVGKLDGDVKTVPQYKTETGILRVVRGLSADELVRYFWELDWAVGGYCEEKIVTATAEHMQEALCKAWGLE